MKIPKMRRLEYDLHTSFEFKGTTLEQHMAQWWANINANWGRLEYMLWLMLADIDDAAAHEWTLHFFGTDSKKREDVVRHEVEIFAGDDKEMMAALTLGLDQLKLAKEIRNPLIHGVWKRKGEQIFVQPLKLDAGRFSLMPDILVDGKMLVELEKHMDRATQAFASVGSGAMATKFMRKVDARRAAADRKKELK
jgi:hypothetical protein